MTPALALAPLAPEGQPASEGQLALPVLVLVPPPPPAVDQDQGPVDTDTLPLVVAQPRSRAGLAEGLEWQDQALCAQTDPEAFYPEKGGSTREAKAVCAVCPVRVECLDYALENDERFGIWGGLSERERRRVKKKGV